MTMLRNLFNRVGGGANARFERYYGDVARSGVGTRRPMRLGRTCSSSTAPLAGTVGCASRHPTPHERVDPLCCPRF